jgi:RNA methyltransferase, TrmH family
VVVFSGEQNRAMPSTPNSLKRYRELADKKGRMEQGVFLVEGEKAISQIVASHPDEIKEIISIEQPYPIFRGYPLRTVNQSQYQYISSTQTPQGIAAIVRLPSETYSSTLPTGASSRILLLEDIQDPGNVGTLIRTAAALGFSGVILTNPSADPFSPKAVQAAAGTVLSIWLRRTAQYQELTRSLKQAGYAIVAADVHGSDKPAILSKQGKMLLILGNEAAGVSDPLLSIADYRVRIPTPPDKAESLNVAACGAILMYLASLT